MTSYTLYYFNGRGRAEISRMLFAAAGVQYEDKRIEFRDWDHFKSQTIVVAHVFVNMCMSTDYKCLQMPCSRMPVLEIDGDTLIPQSMAIARYLAREFGFYGKNHVDRTRIDYICNSLYDIMDDYLRMYQDRDGRIMFDQFADIRQRYKDIVRLTDSDMQLYSSTGDRLHKGMMIEMLWRYQETCRRVLPFLERMLKMYRNGNLYFMGERMTIADMMCHVALENPVFENAHLLDRYPKLASLRARIATHQKILPYIKMRPKTEF